ncbi:hypothetical protein JKF63_03746 [Porcisia hertigi]|uniref:C3H1-type domain-containing protein n=1 Tax=Porcisia hertigi TaxID=2761500 RepID=A0A836LEX5_9TRYP|nr:hypothetical protein JKF63_03746 [Porcisia hertigi]
MDTMMQRPHYDARGHGPQYDRAAYNDGGYNMSQPMNGMPQQGYSQSPVNYYQHPQGYPMGNPMYNVMQGYPPAMPGYRGGRGRGDWYYPSAGRGGYNNMRGGFRGGRGSFPMRRKKPFVGGTLETQREWERQTACCFNLQGSCKFGDGCRFLHEEVEGRACQFGDRCRVHGTGENAKDEAVAKEPVSDKEKKTAESKPKATESPTAKKNSECPTEDKSEEPAAAE